MFTANAFEKSKIKLFLKRLLLAGMLIFPGDDSHHGL